MTHGNTNKDFYAIFHLYDVDGGIGDAIPQEDMVGIVFATEEEAKAFFDKWNKPEVYDKPYAELEHHRVSCRKIEISDIASLVPYDVYQEYE